MVSRDVNRSQQREVRSWRAAEVANTFEWLVTALILALVFRAFVMEAFRIPTGSMAGTLRGAHFRLRCPQCGYRYDNGFTPERYNLPQDTVPRGQIRQASRCPSCGYYYETDGTIPVVNGDRILVLKCIYQFFEPRRWDVVVFKNPLNPRINYIKRLIGRPGETVEIIDGDIYVDGLIARKPPKVQEQLWMVVYDNDYQPVQPRRGSFNGHFWRRPFRNKGGSQWQLAGQDGETVFSLDSAAGQVQTIVYDTALGNDFRATYAYNDVRRHRLLPYCSDLKVRFYVQADGMEGCVGASLSKYGRSYRASVDRSGRMVLRRVDGAGVVAELAEGRIGPMGGDSVLVEFMNVDHQLIFRAGGGELRYDLGRSPGDAGRRLVQTEPGVEIFGSGRLELRNVGIFRDIHYTSSKYGNGFNGGRGVEGHPVQLGADEFFVLGDNSPNSEDCRWWSRRGLGNNGRSYRKGIVPRDYLVGKALFVYWPSGFRPAEWFPIAVIPNVGEMHFIYGGSDKSL